MRGFLCPTQSSFRVQQLPLELFPFFQLQVSSYPFEPDQELQRYQGAEVFQQFSAQLQERSDSERKNPQPARRSDSERKNPQPPRRSDSERKNPQPVHCSDSQCFPLKLQPAHRSDADRPNANSPEADSQPPERKNTQYQQAQHSYPEYVKPFEFFALLPLAEYLVLLEIAHDLEGKVVDYPVFNR